MFMSSLRFLKTFAGAVFLLSNLK